MGSHSFKYYMKPILMTTPRTGSTVISEMLGNLATQYFGYKDILGEFFTITKLYEFRFEIIQDRITQTYYERVNRVWFSSEREERLKRLSLLKNDSNYMIKIFPIDLEPEITEFIANKYDVVYLERKDKLAQLISFMALLQYNIAHYNKNDTKVINNIQYNKTYANIFFDILDKYYRFKNEYVSKFPVIYYEDFMDGGADEAYIINHLGLSIDNYQPYNYYSKKTPYTNDPEYLISNKDEWEFDKQRILTKLNSYIN